MDKDAGQIRRPLALLAVLALLLLPCCGIYILLRPAMPRAKLAQITKGMSKSDVRRVLGEPREKKASDWHFWRWGNAGWVTISFDGVEHVNQVNDESVFPDRKLIDQ